MYCIIIFYYLALFKWKYHESFINLFSLLFLLVQVDFPTSSFEVRFSTPPPAEFSPKYEFSRLEQNSQRQLQDILNKKSLFW